MRSTVLGGRRLPLWSNRHYTHTLIRTAVRHEDTFWTSVMVWEYNALFVATYKVWWHETNRGHTGFLVREENIKLIEESFLVVSPIDTQRSKSRYVSSTICDYVFSYMRELNIPISWFVTEPEDPYTTTKTVFRGTETTSTSPSCWVLMWNGKGETVLRPSCAVSRW